jgi:ribosomal protein L23
MKPSKQSSQGLAATAARKPNTFEVIQYPVSTEKAVRLMEAENTLIFVVAKDATKTQVKKAFAKAFNVKVLKVRISNGHDGKKRAFIKLSPENLAVDITTQLGLA